MNRYYRTLIIGGSNLYKNAIRVFSLRDFGFGVITNVIRVVRSTGGSEFFTFSEITDGTMLNWVNELGDADGIVSRIYCQKTGRFATPRSAGVTSSSRSTGGAIVVNGVLQLENGKPIIRRYSANNAYRSRISPAGDNRHIFAVIKKPENFNNTCLLGTQNGAQSIWQTDTGTGNPHNLSVVTDVRINGVNNNNILTRNDARLAITNQSIVNLKADLNWAVNHNFAIGFRPQNGTSGYGIPDFQEAIVFYDYQNADKIEEEQNEYYNAF